MSIIADPAGTLGLIGGAITSVSALAHQVVGCWSARRLEAERQQTIRQVACDLVHAQARGSRVVALRYSSAPNGTITVEVVRAREAR
jgi:hypothetical protein